MYTDLEFTSIVVENANQLQHNFDVAATVQNIIVVMMMMMMCGRRSLIWVMISARPG